MAKDENRESFVLRWLDMRGLLVRHDDLAPEDILTREYLEPWLMTTRGWVMFRRVGEKIMEAP